MRSPFGLQKALPLRSSTSGEPVQHDRLQIGERELDRRAVDRAEAAPAHSAVIAQHGAGAEIPAPIAAASDTPAMAWGVG